MTTTPNVTFFPNYTEMSVRVPQRVWYALRIAGVLTILTIIVLLFTLPEIGLLIFWGFAVPLLPLLFFLAPGVWRNVCPLAATNQIPRLFGFTRGLTLPPWLREYAYLIGVALFLLIVPNRKILFDNNGPALALLLIVIFSAAFAGGMIFKGKSGWCSTFCPLLPVQRLYGQTPFATVPNAHCQPCVGCTKNCYDFNPSIAYLSDMYEDRRYASYRRFFAGMFPGFVLAFYTVPPASTLPLWQVYGYFGLFMLVSLGIFTTLEVWLKTTPIQLPALFGALAFAFYYWFNIPLYFARVGKLLNFQTPEALIWSLQLAVIGLTIVWLIRTYRREPKFLAQFLPHLAAPTTLAAAPASLTVPQTQGNFSVTFVNENKIVPVQAGLTLLETIESCGLQIEAGCRMGVCGADPVAIMQGMENLSTVGHDERATLQRLGLAENTRMACRARVQGAVSVSLTPERDAIIKPVTVAGFKFDPAVKRVVILGNGIAGVTAADHVRRRHPDCEIHLVGRENHHLYNRMGISRLIYGRSAMHGLYLLPEAWYDEYKITLWLNTRATGIDRAAQTVALATGETLPYDRLILAMGSRSFMPPIEGFGIDGAFVLREANDAMRVRAFAQEYGAQHAVVAGGGLLGLEAAYALLKLGLQVTVLERSERLLSRQLDRHAANLLREELEDVGMQFLFKAETGAVLGQNSFAELLVERPQLQQFFGSRARGTGRVTNVLLKDGRTLPCQMVLVAVGISPNVELAQQANLKTNKGVVVDKTMRTDDPNIFAVGDVAEFEGQVSGLWPPAVEQAEVAAINAVGGSAQYNGSVPVTMLKVVGIDLTSIGQFEARSAEELVIALEEIAADTELRRYRKLVIANGKIIGAILLGYPVLGPIVTEAVKQQVDAMPYLEELRAGNWNVLNELIA